MQSLHSGIEKTKNQRFNRYFLQLHLIKKVVKSNIFYLYAYLQYLIEHISHGCAYFYIYNLSATKTVQVTNLSLKMVNIYFEVDYKLNIR